MDLDKFKHWQDMAKKFYGNDFWSSVFENQRMNESPDAFPGIFSEERSVFPPVDIYINSIEMVVIIELPGMRKDQIELAVEGNQLHIRGVGVPPYPGHEHIKKERHTGEFDRTVELPEVVQREGVKTHFGDGLLQLVFPRTKRFAKNKIEID